MHDKFIWTEKSGFPNDFILLNFADFPRAKKFFLLLFYLPNWLCYCDIFIRYEYRATGIFWWNDGKKLNSIEAQLKYFLELRCERRRLKVNKVIWKQIKVDNAIRHSMRQLHVAKTNMHPICLTFFLFFFPSINSSCFLFSRADISRKDTSF